MTTKITIEVRVKHQYIVARIAGLVSDTVNVYECHFVFDNSWDSLTKTAVFKLNGEDAYEMIIDENSCCMVPHEAVANKGTLRIGVYGSDGEVRYPTIWSSDILVRDGCSEGKTPEPPTPDVYEQLLAKYEELSKRIPTVDIAKVDDYLYSINCNNLDYMHAKEYFWSKHPSTGVNVGACSSVRKGNLFGRNFDWKYDEHVEFVVKTPANNDRHSVIGVTGSLDKLTREFVESGNWDEVYKILPFMLVDGINDSGLVCSMHVVPLDKGKTTGTIPAEEIHDHICSLMLPRYILDKFSSADEAISYINKHVSVYYSASLHDIGYELHFMIADKDKTYVIEFVDNQLVVIENPYLTNFYLDGVRFESDGSVKTPETGDAISENHITEYGSGLERYNLINSYDGPIDQLMSDLAFTNAYKRTTEPFWYSEFVGGDVKVNSSIDEFESVADRVISEFEHRSRDGKTWQTSHSCIYDIKNKTLVLKSQENLREYFYKFNYLQ